MTLALEFSSLERSVAVVDKHRGALGFCSDRNFQGKSGTSLAAGLLEAHAIKPEDITKIAVGLGPGSYTGIRSAIAIAQGWQLARNIPTVGVSSMEVLARSAQEHNFSGIYDFLIDAQRNEFYHAKYDLGENPPVLLQKLELIGEKEVDVGWIIAGPDISRVREMGRNLYPRADVLGKLALPMQANKTADRLEPIYLREIAFVKAPR